MRIGKSLLISIGLLAGIFPTLAQNVQKASAKADLSPQEVIRRFTTKESELKELFKEYSYQQESNLQVLGPARTISGEFYQVSEFVFDDAGKRLQKIIKAPPSTLDQAGLTMTSEDQNAFINLQPFALAAEDLPNYNVNYVGKEKIDDLTTYVFDVVPKVMSDPKALNQLKKDKVEGKYFQGRVWVDDQDFQIVKTAGKTVPEFKQRFPKFETYRENIDGRYWFPTYTSGEDELIFEKGPSVHVRLLVRYKNYRKFSGDLKILDSVEEAPEDQKQPANQNHPKDSAPAQAKPSVKPTGKSPE